MADDASETLLTLTADIVAAHVANNTVAPDQVAALIGNVHAALAGLGTPAIVEEVEQAPAVSIRASVKQEHLVCLEDGKKMKMLKRHLMTDHAMTPAEYRAKWKLPADYPMVAPAYAEKRRNLAVSIGLGRKGGRRKAVASAAPATPKVTRKPRAKKAPA